MTLRFATALSTAAWILIASNAAAQVFKCEGADGKTTYSDQPCRDSGRTSTVNTRGNTVDTQHLRDEAARSRRARASAAQSAQQPSVHESESRQSRQLSSSERDRRIHELRLVINSPSVPKERREEAQEELGRLYRGTDLRRTPEEEKRLRDLQVDLGSIDEKTRERAKREIEMMTDRHESPEYIQNREARRTAEAVDRAAEAVERAERKRRTLVITDCDPGGCNSNIGRLTRLGDTGNFVGPNGVCRRVGQQMFCP